MVPSSLKPIDLSLQRLEARASDSTTALWAAVAARTSMIIAGDLLS
jgi:hypothetical protein